MTVRRSSKKKQGGRKKSGRKQPRRSQDASRKTVNPRNDEESLKLFSPFSVRPSSSSNQPRWQRVTREDRLQVTPNPGHSSGRVPVDPFSMYMYGNKHVWTDTAVIRDDTRAGWYANFSAELEELEEAQEEAEREGKDKEYETVADIEKYDLSCLENPEEYFCLKKVDGMGHGLFAKQDIAEGWFIYFLLAKKFSLSV